MEKFFMGKFLVWKINFSVFDNEFIFLIRVNFCKYRKLDLYIVFLESDY